MASLVFAPPLAHLGHWYVSLPVFGGPVLVLALALKVQTWREARGGPDQTGKRSIVSNSRTADGRATVSVSGPLDYPALLELEVELGKIGADASEIVLDLRRLTSADEDAVTSLCDAIGDAQVHDRIEVLLPPGAAAHVLGGALAGEGVRLH